MGMRGRYGEREYVAAKISNTNLSCTSKTKIKTCNDETCISSK